MLQEVNQIQSNRRQTLTFSDYTSNIFSLEALSLYQAYLKPNYQF